jgi:hypothetical protein
MGWTFSGGNPGMHRAIIDFDLSTIPDHAIISEAYLYLYYFCHPPDNLPHAGENQAYLKLISTHWEEGLVTWNTQPFTSGDYIVNVPASTGPEQDYEIDVTSLIRQLHENPGSYYGMMLQLENEDPYNCLIFGSSDNTDPTLRPRLTIEYCFPPECTFEYAIESGLFSFTSNSPAATSWWWDFGDGHFSDLQHPVHWYSSNGTYDVCLTVEDECGSSTSCDTINFQSFGLEEKMHCQFRIFPNPASEAVTIRLPEQEKFKLYLRNSIGATCLMIKDIKGNPGEYKIDVSGFPSGLYVLNLIGGRYSMTEKLTIQR